jgi:hypothetical protein
MDALYIGLGVMFFISAWGLMKLCDYLAGHRQGEES